LPVFYRVTDVLAYVTILSVCLSGAFRQSVWTIVAGCMILSLLALQHRWKRGAIHLRGNQLVADSVEVGASVLNGGGTAVAAYLLGLGAAVVWNV
jgi:hypothetical protein